MENSSQKLLSPIIVKLSLNLLRLSSLIKSTNRTSLLGIIILKYYLDPFTMQQKKSCGNLCGPMCSRAVDADDAEYDQKKLWSYYALINFGGRYLRGYSNRPK